MSESLSSFHWIYHRLLLNPNFLDLPQVHILSFPQPIGNSFFLFAKIILPYFSWRAFLVRNSTALCRLSTMSSYEKRCTASFPVRLSSSLSLFCGYRSKGHNYRCLQVSVVLEYNGTRLHVKRQKYREPEECY